SDRAVGMTVEATSSTIASIAFLITAKVIGSPRGSSRSAIAVLHLDRDAASASGARSTPRRNDNCGVVTFDDCRTGDRFALQSGARDEPRRDPRCAAAERDHPLAALTGQRARIQSKPIEVEPACRLANGGEAQIDELDRLAFGDIAEGFKI